MDNFDFSDLHVLVVGDVMLDKYIYGEIRRISPEAPVPILKELSRSASLGGAANVAMNIKSLGAQCTILGVSGEDKDGSLLDELIAKELNLSSCHIIKDSSRCTTVKTRCIAGGQHVLRIDEEQVDNISENVVENILSHFQNLLEGNSFDVVILQDYNKGLFTGTLIESIIRLANSNKIPIVVDPKLKNIDRFKGVQLFKPNFKEFKMLINDPNLMVNETMLLEKTKVLKQQLDVEEIWVTLGDKGLFYLNKDNEYDYVATTNREVVDVCGAGDAVLSVLALAYGASLSSPTISKLANIAGGIVCEKLGVYAINIDELRNEFKELHGQ